MKRTVCAVFDIDDTLYLERDYVRSGFEAVGRWAAKWIQTEDFGERCWRRFAAGRRKSIFDEVLCESGRMANPELVSALVEVYRTHTPSIALAPDAAEALEVISRIASIAVISDGPLSSQSRKAEALGLRSFAEPIMLTEALGGEFRKPHPRAFQQIEHCRPASVYVYIADNPLKDFAAPKQLGWITVRVRRPDGLHYMLENPQITPDREMGDCSGLPEVLAQL
ncbi:MAG: HAD family hydrolase [Acidobacteriia bacterium]|nr:HAD family hydrolase [Terriglobia bacterium]